MRYRGRAPAVEARSTSCQGWLSRVLAGAPDREAAIRSSTERAPRAAASVRTVVSAMRSWLASGMSSNPTTDTSRGTRQPVRSSRPICSIATVSSWATTAVGSSSQLDMVEPAPRDGLRERTLAALATGLAERTAGEREPRMTETLQVRDERVERPLLVDVDDPDPLTGLGAEASEQHGDATVGDVLGCERSRAQTGDQDGIDAALEQSRDLRALGLGVAAGVRDQEAEALVPGAPLRPERELRVERVPLVGDDGPDHVGRALAQRPRNAVRPVPEIADRILDAFARRRADDVRAPHDVRHRRLRHARVAGDVADRGRISHATVASWNASISVRTSSRPAIASHDDRRALGDRAVERAQLLAERLLVRHVVLRRAQADAAVAAPLDEARRRWRR